MHVLFLNDDRDHSFSTNENYSEKLAFPIP